MVKKQQSAVSRQCSVKKYLNILGFILSVTFGIPSVALPQQPQTQTDPIYAVNAKYVQGVGPGYWPTAGSNLTLNLTSGTAVCGNTVQTYAGGTLTLAANATNYVYLNTAQSCIPASNTTGFNSTTIPIAIVGTNTNSITSITDVRTMFVSGATGTLTSVAMTGDGVIYNTAVPGSPITTSGTLAPQLLSQTANTLLAGPGSGVAALPTFRTLVSADLPTIAISGGGTGQTTAAAAFNALSPLTTEGDLNYYHTGANIRLGIGGSGQCLTSNGTDPAWGSCGGGGAWSAIGNPTANLTLSMSTYTTTYNHTSAANWTWANTTAATSGTAQSSPIFNLSGTYWTGAASGADSWSLQDLIASGTNGNSILTLAHAGSTTGIVSVSVPNLINTSTTQYGVEYGGGASAVIRSTAAGGSGVPLLGQGASAAPIFGALNLAGGSSIVTGTLPFGYGGTNSTSFTQYGVVVAGASSLSTVGPNASSGLPLLSQGASANPAFAVLGIVGGGTGQTTATAGFNALSPLTTEGDLLYYHTSANARLARGTNGQCLTSNGTDPVWGSCSTGSGTVTSVALAMPSIFSVSGSPVINSGTLTASLTSQTQNLVFASPSGSSGNPSFRSLVGADLPAPTSSTLGGVKSLTCSASQFVNQISTAGAPVCATPSGGGSGLGNGGTVIDASLQAGSDFGAKVNAALALLPATGGVVDARGLVGTQSSSSSITIPRAVTVLLACGLNVTFTVAPMFTVYGNLVGCGGHMAGPQTSLSLSGTTGGSAIVGGSVTGVAIYGVSTSDGSIGFDWSSGPSTSQLTNSSASNFQYDYKIGGGGSESSYNHLEDDAAYGAGTYGFWVTGNAAFNELEHLNCAGLQTCYEFDAQVGTAVNLSAESFTVDAFAFNNSGSQVFGAYIENGPVPVHYKGGYNNIVMGGTARIVGSGVVYDAGVDQISNYLQGVDFGGGPAYMGYWAMTYPLFNFPALNDPFTTELDPSVSWGGTWQALQYSPKGSHGPTQGYSGYAPIGLGGIENRGGITTWGSLVVNGLPSGSNIPAPTMACTGSGTGTTYTASLVISDWNGNKTTPSTAATIKCPNPPSGTYPITVTPVTSWYGSPANGVKSYDYLWGDTAHSFALATLGTQSYTGGSLGAYTAAARNATGDGYVNGWLGVGTSTPGRALELSFNAISLGDQGFRLSYSPSPTSYYGEMVQHYNGSGNGFNYNFNLHDADTAYSGTPFSISSHGQVGIGTANPGQQLDVAGGYVRSDTGFCITSNCVTSLWSNPMTTLGDIVYAGAGGAGTRLAGNTSATTYFLGQTGTGSASAAPIWLQLNFGNISGTVQPGQLLTPVNAQAGTSYTIAISDQNNLVTFNNSSSVALTLPQPGGSFPAGFAIEIENLGAGVVTVTPTASTLNGQTSLTFVQNQGATLVSDGTNWKANLGYGIQGATNLLTQYAVPFVTSQGTINQISNNTTTTPMYLKMTGTGVTGQLPAWGTLTTGDLPSHLATLLTLWCYSALSATSGTYYFGGFGGVQTACNSLTTTLTGGMPVGVGGTIKNLRCAAGAAGHAAGSGVIKIYDGGSAKSPTCTIGTGTTCSDTSNSFTYAAGDLIQFSVASGGAGETLANVSCSAEVWVSAN